ncbi:MAG: Fe-S cluster assembly scaffold protein NifU [Clostridia bacterium]|nr:Fe-S cluster assembly scaffold protein NifU [Clostridia bacterium]
MYNEKVMDVFKNPKNVGEIENADGVGLVGNENCGDIMQIFLKIENDIIVDAKFKTFGCAAAIATSSTATEMVKGMTVEEALKLTNRRVVECLGGLPAQKLHCSVLAEEAIKKAIEDYQSKKQA